MKYVKLHHTVRNIYTWTLNLIIAIVAKYCHPIISNIYSLKTPIQCLIYKINFEINNTNLQKKRWTAIYKKSSKIKSSVHENIFTIILHWLKHTLKQKLNKKNCTKIGLCIELLLKFDEIARWPQLFFKWRTKRKYCTFSNLTFLKFIYILINVIWLTLNRYTYLRSDLIKVYQILYEYLSQV